LWFSICVYVWFVLFSSKCIAYDWICPFCYMVIGHVWICSFGCCNNCICELLIIDVVNCFKIFVWLNTNCFALGSDIWCYWIQVLEFMALTHAINDKVGWIWYWFLLLMYQLLGNWLFINCLCLWCMIGSAAYFLLYKVHCGNERVYLG